MPRTSSRAASSRKLRAGVLVALAALGALPPSELARAQLALPSGFPQPPASPYDNPQRAPVFAQRVQRVPRAQPDDQDQDAIGAGPDQTNPPDKKRATNPTVQTTRPPIIPQAAISAARLPQNQNRTRRGTAGATANARANIGVAAGATSSGPELAPGPNAITAAVNAPNALAATVADPLLVDPSLLPRTLIRRPAIDEKPFDPTGIHAGSFLLRPAIELTSGVDTNPARTNPGSGASAVAVVAPELQAASDWERHALTLNLRSSYAAYVTQPALNRPYVDGRLDGRIDVTQFTAINLEARTLVSTDYPGSPNIQAGLARLPIFVDVGGTAGIDQRFNRLDFVLKGSVDRTTYANSVFTDGEVASNADRNFNQYATQFRAGYDLQPGVQAFAQLDVDQRRYDLLVDASGFERDSDGIAGKLGTSFRVSPILTGQVALGYLTRDYVDPRLAAVQGTTLDGSLLWLATALTSVKLTAATVASETTLAGVSGVLTHELSAEVDHAFRRWLDAALIFKFDNDNYVGSPRDDHRFSAGTQLTYKLTRDMWLRGELRRDWLVSNIPVNDYQAYVALLTLRLQR